MVWRRGSGISMSFHSTKAGRGRFRAGARASASASGVEPSEGPLGTSRSPPRSPPARRRVRCSGGARQSPIALPDSWTCLAGRGTTTASVAVMDVGPDLQFIANPGEAFPALMLGGPWGIEDASCPNRENPPVPTWHASAKYRFQVGLGDDLIGYEKPPWSFLYDTPGSFTPTDCTSDPHNHSHALEDEALGPTAANLLAHKLADLLDANPDPIAEIRLGRYVTIAPPSRSAANRVNTSDMSVIRVLAGPSGRRITPV